MHICIYGVKDFFQGAEDILIINSQIRASESLYTTLYRSSGIEMKGLFGSGGLGLEGSVHVFTVQVVRILFCPGQKLKRVFDRLKINQHGNSG